MKWYKLNTEVFKKNGQRVKGEQYDEATYTRDERHTFASVDELMAFLKINDLRPEDFTP